MFKTTVDLLDLWIATSPFLFSTIAWTLLALLLHRSIKENARLYYWGIALLSLVNFMPYVFHLLGIELGFTLSQIPILGRVLMEFSKAAYFIHPMLVIIMYMGALNTKNRYVRQLMSIRKELSIIVGFPVLGHAIKRIIFTLPHALEYFVDNDSYIQNDRYYVSALGSGISSAVYIIGVVMTVIFLVLWVTSFDSVRRHMSAKRWISTQRWAYLLYALLFIHAVGIKTAGAVKYSASERIKREKIELVDSTATDSSSSVKIKSDKHKSFSLRDIEVSWALRSYVNIAVYILIYGSYLVLRLRKARRSRLRRMSVNCAGA